MTALEHQLQSFRPKLLREIRLDEPCLTAQDCTRRFRSATPPALVSVYWRYVAACLAGFFLGVCVTYFAMQSTRWLASPAVVSPSFAERVIVLPLDEQTIGTLQRPIDLMRVRPQTVSVRPIEPPNILTPMSVI